MKKMLLALAIVLALVVVTPASAQGYYGRPVGAIEATANTQNLVNDLFDQLPGYPNDPARYRYDRGRYNSRNQYGNRGRYNNRDYRYNGYGQYDRYGYDNYDMGVELSGRNMGAVLGGVAGGIATRNSRSGWTKAAGIIGGAVLGGVLGNQIDHRNNDYRSDSEEPSKCFARVVKSARKNRVQIDTGEAMAMCSGQPLHPPQPEMEPESEPMAMNPRQQRMTEPPQARRLCNRSGSPIVVYRDGRELGELAPGQFTIVEPGGKLGVHSESCELQGIETGNDVNLSCQ